MLKASAARCEDSRLRLHTLTISTPGIAWSPGICRTRVLFPAPTIPMRIGAVICLSFARVPTTRGGCPPRRADYSASAGCCQSLHEEKIRHGDLRLVTAKQGRKPG